MTLDDFVDAAAAASGETVEMVCSPIRGQGLARIRQAAMALAYRHGFSAPRVGSAFGGRDHTTVLYAVRRYMDGALEGEAARVEAELTGQEALL